MSEVSPPNKPGQIAGAPVVVSVVVNFRGRIDSMRCIESLLTSTYEKHSIVVVDNGSGNDDADRIEDRFGGRIELIRAPRNLG